METVLSKNGIMIRLTAERWSHITEEHCELAGMKLEVLETIANPIRILAGHYGEKLALQEIEEQNYLFVVDRESEEDRFIITAFLTRRLHSLEKREFLWP